MKRIGLILWTLAALFPLTVRAADLVVDRASWKGIAERTYWGHEIRTVTDWLDVSDILKKDGYKAAAIDAAQGGNKHVTVVSSRANVALIPLSMFADECEKAGIKLTVVYVVDTSNQSFDFRDDNLSYNQRRCFLFSIEGMAEQKNCESVVIRASHPMAWSDERSHAAEQFRRVVENATKAIGAERIVAAVANDADFRRVFAEDPKQTPTPLEPIPDLPPPPDRESRHDATGLTPPDDSRSVFEPFEATVYTLPNCVPCRVMHDVLGVGDARLRLTWVTSAPPAEFPQLVPLTVWVDANGQRRYVKGNRPLDYILRAIKDNDPPTRKVVNK